MSQETVEQITRRRRIAGLVALRASQATERAGWR